MSRVTESETSCLNLLQDPSGLRFNKNCLNGFFTNSSPLLLLLSLKSFNSESFVLVLLSLTLSRLGL